MEVLAQRGVEGITIREVTDAANANVAAVSYHFGSLQGLCDAAIELALEHYLDAQLEATSALSTQASVEDLATAFAGPMIAALSFGGADLTIMRTVARVAIDPPRDWERLAGKFDQSRRDVLRVLATWAPDIDEAELLFRIRCAAGILNWLALAPIGTELEGTTPARLQRLLVPVIAGAFLGHRED
jgi:AcrR family transcriptional regulator